MAIFVPTDPIVDDIWIATEPKGVDAKLGDRTFAMARAKRLDAEDDPAVCMQALAEARRMYILPQ